MPAGASAAPGRLPPGVLAFLRRLPEGEVTRILLQRARLLLLDLVGPMAGESAVRREAGDAEVHVSAGLIRVPGCDELLDERDDLGDRLGRERLLVGHLEPEGGGVLEVPLRRPARALGAVAGGGLVDLVVHVGDVVDVRDLVPLHPEPVPQPREDDEGARIADVGTLVHGGPADVHADRRRGRRQLDERASGGVVDPDGHRAVIAVRPGRRGRAPLHGRARQPRPTALLRGERR